MKVSEKGAMGRSAEVHVHVQENVEELREYGEYIDPNDKAICSYVAVEEGNIVKLTGKFKGTTLSVAHDLYIDGVLRKPNSMVSKEVKTQKCLRLDSETVLFQTEDGILDTTMKVVPVSGVAFSKHDGRETVGTIELRLYVFRTHAADHPLEDSVVSYLDDGDDEDSEENEEVKKTAKYRTIAPDFMMEFEKNCQVLDSRAVNAWKKRLTARRPSKEPWAIFRFHYRSKEAIEAQHMELTYDPKRKGKGAQVHELDLEPVPDLVIGQKPPKAGDGESTRASSIPPSTPFDVGSPAFQRPATTMSPAVQKRTKLEEAEKATTPPDTPTEAEAAQSIEGTPTAPAASMSTPVPLAAPTLKRPAAPTPLTLTPETKRTKRFELAETRKQLMLAKAERESLAKQRAEVDEQLAPYEADLQAEQELLQKELDEERRALREEEQALKDDICLLEELKKAEKQV